MLVFFFLFFLILPIIYNTLIFNYSFPSQSTAKLPFLFSLIVVYIMLAHPGVML